MSYEKKMIHVKKICGVQKSFHSGIIDKFSQHKCGKKFGMRKTTLELTIKIHRLCKFVQKLYRFCDIFFVENLVPVLKSDIDFVGWSTHFSLGRVLAMQELF